MSLVPAKGDSQHEEYIKDKKGYLKAQGVSVDESLPTTDAELESKLREALDDLANQGEKIQELEGNLQSSGEEFENLVARINNCEDEEQLKELKKSLVQPEEDEG